MLGVNALSSCSRCLISASTTSSLSAQQLFTSSLLYTTRRFRSGKPAKRGRSAGKHDSSPSFSKGMMNAEGSKETTKSSKKWKFGFSIDDRDKIIAHFESHVRLWSERQGLPERLQSFGVPKKDIKPLLNLFASDVESKALSTDEAYDYYCLERFARFSPEHDTPEVYSDIVYTSILYAWASNPINKSKLKDVVPRATIRTISRLFDAANMEYPGDRYVEARRMRRKIIMHVGPTNSGKTHNALRALAAASSGVYAGPLRLLAHEIWERLNLGQIVPLGVEEESVVAPEATSMPADVDTDTALDAVVPSPALRSSGNPKYRRICNMLTGEEHKIVEENSPLLSCTVEMLSTSRKYEVAVVDEIQMIADEARGYAWTNAVLGLCAKEIHLCGEETAVPIVEALLKDTNDELIVNRYQRLTPLEMDKSLEGSFKNIQKGDCIVTFSRRNIFSVKKQVEKLTGMRCAVVYGGLPPEIRAEQADLFNNVDSGYDVIIGSDAIGMGLNLKIRRIIFESISKFDGGRIRALSLSQTKQIAGRAGRFGLLQEQRGYVSALHDASLGFIRKALASTPPPLVTARLGPDSDTSRKILQALPPESSMGTIYNAHLYVSRTRPFCRYTVLAALDKMSHLIDKKALHLSLADRVMFMTAPIPWRQDDCLPFVESMMGKYSTTYSVSLSQCVQGSDFTKVLDRVEEQMASGNRYRTPPTVLSSLENFHRCIGLYTWLSFRQPVAFSDTETAADLKERVEKALQWCLEGTSQLEAVHSRIEAVESPKAKEGAIEFQSAIDVKKRKIQEAVLAAEERKRMVPVQA